MDAKDVIEGLAIAHAQGFAAGQLDMQDRAARTAHGYKEKISEPHDWLIAVDIMSAIRALPIKDQP